MSTDVSDTVRKIPILGDIPLIGRYLFSSVSKTEDTKELIVLMTPYVMTNLDEMTGQTERLYRGTNIEQEDWGQQNWSQSALRAIPDDRNTELADEEPAPTTSAPQEQPDSAPKAEQSDELYDILNSM